MMSEFSAGVVRRPALTLEDVREVWDANKRDGRGRESASSRGYNAERLSEAVLGDRVQFFAWSGDGRYDNFVSRANDVTCKVESKCCVSQYPSGGYGRFRIWARHHFYMVAAADVYSKHPRVHLYFFVVYRLEDGIETEVGKLVVPVVMVDAVLEDWKPIDHSTMGTQRIRDISWRLLLRSLDVSVATFESEDVIDLSVGWEGLRRSREALDS